jgi:hypothetical protein
LTGQALTSEGAGATYDATIEFIHNSPIPDSTTSISISLTMLVPELRISDATAVSSTYQNWGTEVLTVRTVYLTNDGNSDLELSQLSYQETAWLQASLLTTTDSPLELPYLIPVSGAVKLVFKYDLKSDMTAQLYEDTVVLTHDAPLPGTQVSWPVRLNLNTSAVFSYSLDTPEMTQSVISTSTEEAIFQLTFTNDGRKSVTFSGVVFEGPFIPCDVISTCLSPSSLTSLDPSLSQVVTFTVASIPAGSSEGNISFYHDAINQPNPLMIPFYLFKGDPDISVQEVWTVGALVGGPSIVENLLCGLQWLGAVECCNSSRTSQSSLRITCNIRLLFLYRGQ